jgi:hypothetical protein
LQVLRLAKSRFGEDDAKFEPSSEAEISKKSMTDVVVLELCRIPTMHARRKANEDIAIRLPGGVTSD